MRIQTQARLLVAGIVLAPLLIICTNVVYRFLVEEDVYGLPAYEDVNMLMEEPVSVKDWESLIQFVGFSRNHGETTVFRDDFFVLYSSNPEFAPGIFAGREKVMSLLGAEDPEAHYNFFLRNLSENRIYILNKITPQQSVPRWPHLFFPVFSFFVLLSLFTIGMSIVITRTITRSVQVLENATRRIAEGELDLNVDVKGSNEITSLTNSLNKMRNALKEEELRRSRFIMGITHDLKTPLALIKGYAEAIEDDVVADNVSRSSATEIIIDKADQLEGMINDLINFVHMETGEWRGQLVELNAAAFFRTLVQTLSVDIELLHHEFSSDINLPENLLIPMDERLVQRAMENLIYNAVRHTPAGSIICFSALVNKNTVEITITDNGPGIDKKDLPHVFEMFYRGTSSRREQGLGLGLAVVKWVADYHGWLISVSSTGDVKKGRETCFTIGIPLMGNGTNL